MNAHYLIAIALAALLVFAGGAAALPGQASDAAEDNQPDDPGADASEQADENATDDAAENVTETAENETADEDAREEDAAAGPPTDIPAQAPDHVTQIHDLVRSKLDGALTGPELGTAISDLMGSEDGAEEQPDADASQSENATDTGEDAQSTADHAGPPADLPSQAADHVGAIHDAISSWLNGGSDGNPGEDVSSTAG
jgi:hypothetical protein